MVYKSGFTSLLINECKKYLFLLTDRIIQKKGIYYMHNTLYAGEDAIVC